MPEIELLATGEGDYRLHDPDALRAWMRDRKRRDLVDKTTTAAEAVGRLDTGPWRVVTSQALFGFDEVSHELTLLGVLEGRSVDAVVAEMGVKPRVAAHVERLAPPSPRELEILRDQIDPARALIGRTAKS